eukprot:2312596-Amphidinium_carterae.1
MVFQLNAKRIKFVLGWLCALPHTTMALAAFNHKEVKTENKRACLKSQIHETYGTDVQPEQACNLLPTGAFPRQPKQVRRCD